MGGQDRLLGKPVVTSTLMPEVAAGAYVAVYGDFNNGYTIAQQAPGFVAQIEKDIASQRYVVVVKVTLDGAVNTNKSFRYLRMKV